MDGGFSWPDFARGFAAAAERAGFYASPLVATAAGPLTAWEKPGPGRKIYLSAGIHGDEPAGPLALLALMEDGFFAGPDDWTLCPALNPTGLAAGTRENAGGIDLNRDYFQRRSAEAAAHAEWLAARPVPDLFLSLHEDWETEGFYFYEINLGFDRPDRAMAILDAVTPWFPAEAAAVIDGHAPRGAGWIYHPARADVPEGWPEAIYLADRGCPLSFTFETPSNAPLDARVAAHVAAVRAACGSPGQLGEG